jgi:hypothetical protein
LPLAFEALCSADWFFSSAYTGTGENKNIKREVIKQGNHVASKDVFPQQVA